MVDDKKTENQKSNRRRVWWALGIALAIAIGLGIYFITSSVPVNGVVDLVAQDSAKLLHNPLRTAKPGTRVIVFAFDGVGTNELYNAIRSGRMPHLHSLLGAESGNGLFEHGYAAPDAISILPSTTMAAWASVYTGRPPAETGVPGNEWFAREEMRFYAPAPVSVIESDHTLKMLTDGLVGHAIKTPTLYETLNRRAHVSMAPVYRGADIFTTPDTSELADVFVGVAKGIVSESPVSREVFSELDRESVNSMLEAVNEHGLADLQVVYFPGIDLYSHGADNALDQQVSYLQEILDPAIGRVLEEYRKAQALRETYVLFVADHGHTPVINDDRHSLATDGADEPPALIERAGFRMRPFTLNPGDDEQDYQAAVAYQGAMAYIYLSDRSTCPNPGDRCDWRRPPRLEEDVMPLVQAFYRVNETGDPIPELKGALDLILAREPRPVSESALPFKIFDGSKLVPISEYLKRHPRPDLIQFEERMEKLSSGPMGHRAGDILLLACSGLERPIEERFYFSSLYRSWHGSPTGQDSCIPFILARLEDSGERLSQLVKGVAGNSPSQLHVVPLIQKLLSKQ